MPAWDEELFRDHARTPYHHRPPTDLRGFRVLRRRNPRCGDEIEIFLKTDESVRPSLLEEAFFVARSCVLCRTSASILCAEAEGQSVGDIVGISPDEVLQMIGISVTPGRRDCVLLPLVTLQACLRLAHDE